MRGTQHSCYSVCGFRDMTKFICNFTGTLDANAKLNLAILWNRVDFARHEAKRIMFEV